MSLRCRKDNIPSDLCAVAHIKNRLSVFIQKALPGTGKEKLILWYHVSVLENPPHDAWALTLLAATGIRLYLPATEDRFDCPECEFVAGQCAPSQGSDHTIGLRAQKSSLKGPDPSI